MDLKKLTDVELVEMAIELLAGYPDRPKELAAMRDELRGRGHVRRHDAFAAVGNQREAVRRKEAGL